MDFKDDEENTNYRPQFDELRDTNILSAVKNTETAPNSVFIAFHASDAHFARALMLSLKDNQRKVWIDFQEANLSADWLDAIHKGIENTDVFIFILSPNSNESRACSFQLEHAVKNGKRVIPVCCKPVDYRKVIKELAVLNWIVYNPDGSDYKESQRLLYNTVESERLHVQYHTKILRRAIEWERHDFEKSLLLRGADLERSQHWLSAAALGREPKPTTLHLSFITASANLDQSMNRRRVVAMFFAVIVAIGIRWPSWGVFFFSLIFSHFFVYFSS